jgi:hypothetical protein
MSRLMEISASENTMTMPKKGDPGMISSASISKLMNAEVPGNPTQPSPQARNAIASKGVDS